MLELGANQQESVPPATQVVSPWVWWGLLGAFVAWILFNLQWGRGIAWDEVEFLRATDWIRQGRVPYRDFFEHHTPITWFLMAPFESLAHEPGVAPVLWLRWVQVPLWGIAIWRLNAWMREDGEASWARSAALAGLLGTPLFVLSALEYRVDTLGTVFALLGLDQLRKAGPKPESLAGAFWALAVLANLRFAPFVIAVACLASGMDLESHRWRIQPRRLGRIALGALLALAPWFFYLLFTHSLGAMWQHCFVENKLSQQLMQATRATSVYLSYPFLNFDIPGLLLEAGIVICGLMLIRSAGRPRFLHLLFLAQAVNLAFIAAMKVQFLYHFELTFCLAVPFLGAALHQMAKSLRRGAILERVMVIALGTGLAINLFNLAARNDHPTLVYQDRVLKEAARLAPPGSRVLDGCGWLLDRKPAYRYWFLPVLVRQLSLEGRIPSYSPEEFRQNPPALVIASIRLGNWSGEWPETGKLVITHYLPTMPNVWVPGLSYPFNPKRNTWTWTVPADGEYKLVCHDYLYSHPWFRSPFMIISSLITTSTKFTIDADQFPSEGQDEMSWVLNGRPAVFNDGVIGLKRGDTLTGDFSGKGPLGVLLVPKGTGLLFQPEPPRSHLDYLPITYYGAFE